jgi:hypothetical protein
MTSNVIRNLLLAAPFRPFTIHVAGGKRFPIEHPDEWVHVFLVTRGASSASQATI